jgi:hypothetical protein
MKHLILVSLAVLATNAQATIDMGQIEQDLKGPGVIGEVHGAVPGYDQYVFTVRDPQDFFQHYEFPLTTKNPVVKAELQKLGRHDKIKVKGSFISNKAPIHHINAEEVNVVDKYDDGMKLPPYKHEGEFPKDLEGKTELVGKVHAIAEEGKILVIEYKDAVIPVYTKDNSLTKGLFRNDKIKMKYTLRKFPGSPSHVTLNTTEPNYLVVTDKMVDSHLKKGSIQGHLILFPKSPQVKFNVFALQDIDANGVKREYTLVNFDDPKVFEKIRDRLQELWDTHPGHIENARNKYINLDVTLKATGTFNVVDPGQANPQILLSGPDDLTVIK